MFKKGNGASNEISENREKPNFDCYIVVKDGREFFD